MHSLAPDQPKAWVGSIGKGTDGLFSILMARRLAARQRALPQGPDLPPPHRRLLPVCAPGYIGHKRGEVVRTRTTLLQAHTHRWLASGWRERAMGITEASCCGGLEVIVAYQTALGLSPTQAVVCLDGMSGNGAIVVDLIAAAVGWVMRGKDYGLLDLPHVKERLALPADEQFTHPRSADFAEISSIVGNSLSRLRDTALA